MSQKNAFIISFSLFRIGSWAKGKTGGLTKCNYQNENNREKTWWFNGKLLYLQRVYDTMQKKHVEPK